MSGYRAICRIIRGTGRKWRENECPAVGGEEIRKNGHNKKEDFIPPSSKYSLTDAIGWTTGLVLAYEVTHGRRRQHVFVDDPPSTSILGRISKAELSTSRQCPFGWPTKVVSQPTLAQSVVPFRGDSSHSSPLKKHSIDLTPFIKEDLSVLDLHHVNRPYCSSFEEDEDDIQFTYDSNTNTSNSKSPDRKLRRSSFSTLPTKDVKEEECNERISSARKITGDLFGALGAMRFLQSSNKMNRRDKQKHKTVNSEATENMSDEPPLTALQLLDKGAELGSARSYFNIGVAYERLGDHLIAREYYRKACDLGHPLGTFNTAVFLIRDGRRTEGLELLHIAAEKGVPEAQKITSIPN